MAQTVKIMTANIATSLLGLSDILKREKPELLFLQEINTCTDNVNDMVNTLGYRAECNVDALHPTLPGTAIVWKNNLKVSELNLLIERRAQSVKCAGETFVNVYAPSGSGNRRERWEFFNELVTHIIQSGGGQAAGHGRGLERHLGAV